MGHLCIAAAECGYKEIDRQLKEQFIHGLNDKVMLDKIIRELTSKTISQWTTSEDVLAWVEKSQMQRVQASILSDITETKTFDKLKKEPESKNTWVREANVATHQRQPCRYCGGSHAPRQCPEYGKMSATCGKTGHLRSSAGAKEAA